MLIIYLVGFIVCSLHLCLMLSCKKYQLFINKIKSSVRHWFWYMFNWKSDYKSKDYELELKK